MSNKIDDGGVDFLLERYFGISQQPRAGVLKPISVKPISVYQQQQEQKGVLHRKLAETVEQLKNVEPYKVDYRVPDRVTVITAWRAWRVGVGQTAPLMLQSLGQGDCWQPKKEMIAGCYYRAHRVPYVSCQCGIWAFKSLDLLLPALQPYNQSVAVVGIAALWGRVIETVNGYRAEKAYPVELWLLNPDHEELGLIYDVPVRKL